MYDKQPEKWQEFVEILENKTKKSNKDSKEGPNTVVLQTLIDTLE